MPKRFGSDRSPFQDQSLPILDASGVPLIDTSNGFGSSPLGNAIREQVQFGLPNATFNLIPPDPAQAIQDIVNPLPFWSLQTTDTMTATTIYDSTTSTWGVKLNPGTAAAGDYLTLKTRSWVTTDTNLALRQKASLTLAKNGTYAGTTQWNLTLGAEYFDTTNTSIGSYSIGTALDNATWTSISGTTTSGGSAISSSASWVEFTIKLTATATVTSATSATVQSLLVATSNPLTGSFIVTDTFKASGTWTRPSGVTTLLAVIGIGGGSGGDSGEVGSSNKTALGGLGQGLGAGGSRAGASSSWALIQNIYVGDQTSITVGIGTAGAGGAGTTFSKAAAGTARVDAGTGSVAGGAGGATTFGSYLTVPGGRAGGTAGATATATVYGITTFAAVNSVITGSGNALCAVGTASTTSAYGQLPYQPLPYGAGSSGGTSSGSGGGTVMSGTAGNAGAAGLTASGGGGGRTVFAVSTYALTGTDAGAGGAGGAGGGGAASARSNVGSTTIAGTAGAGGSAGANSGAGGGGGGSMNCLIDTSANYTSSTITLTAGNGGNGGTGVCYVFYVA